jgi:RNA recognition motif-containing protein
MEVQEDTIYVSGLPDDVDEAAIAEYFGQIGIIKVCESKP